MADPVISVSGLTKDYGAGRGIFDISFDVMPGEVFGYLGTNGSGKTTTIRHMMGFIKPQRGEVRVHGMDPWTRAPELMRHVSYIPGEIAFPSFATGTKFLKVQEQYMGVRNEERMNHIIELMNLDPTANLKRMSKGMKQKTAIVAALMADMETLILDEPTTGLDPLMRENFLDLIREEKAMGHTVFMSSHIFEEIEDVCDKVGIIHDGKLMEVLDLSEFRHTSVRKMEIGFPDEKTAQEFCKKWGAGGVAGNIASCEVLPHEMNKLFHVLREFSVASVREEHIGLEEYFMNKYGMKKSA